MAVGAVNAEVRKWLQYVATRLAWRGTEALIDGIPYAEAMAVFLDELEPKPTNLGEDRILQLLRANFDPPKTLSELQRPPDHDRLGYERHHIVEQNKANVEKDDIAFDVVPALDKFGQTAIDDDSNIVWVPRLKHEKITSDYNSAPDEGQPFSRLRDFVNTLDFESQRRIGLQRLQKYGVLK